MQPVFADMSCKDLFVRGLGWDRNHHSSSFIMHHTPRKWDRICCFWADAHLYNSMASSFFQLCRLGDPSVQPPKHSHCWFDILVLLLAGYICQRLVRRNVVLSPTPCVLHAEVCHTSEEIGTHRSLSWLWKLGVPHHCLISGYQYCITCIS